MKCVKIAAAIALCLGFGQAFAQTCAAPLALTAAGVGPVDGCAAGTTNTVGLLCGFNDNPSQDTIFSFTIGAGFTATAIHLTTTTGTFTGQMVVQQACGSTSECLSTGVSVAAGGAVDVLLSTVNPTPPPPTNPLPAGAYFLIVDGATASATDCGSFSLTVNGTLPVQLQKFSVD